MLVRTPSTPPPTTTTLITNSMMFFPPQRQMQKQHPFSPWHWRWNTPPFSARYCHPLHLNVPTMGPLKPTCLEVFMVNNLVFRWPKTFNFSWFWRLMADIPTSSQKLLTPGEKTTPWTFFNMAYRVNFMASQPPCKVPPGEILGCPDGS